jgi:hypothetical protein
MEEITTRFEIIRLAVNLGDFRTIDLQCEKLRSLSLDEKLNEIIDLLESRNYRQALYEMKHYARNLEDDFFSARQTAAPVSKPPRKAPARDLGLFAAEEPEEKSEEQVLDVEDILRMSRKREVPPTAEYRPAPEFAAEPESEAKSSAAEEPEGERTDESSEASGLTPADHPVEEPETPEVTPDDVPVADGMQESTVEFREEEWLPEEEDDEEREEPEIMGAELRENQTISLSESGEEEGTTRHPPISYISQKFRNMIHQFPPVDQEGEIPEEVERMQKKISSEGYTEEEIEAFLRHYQEYKEEGKRTEAAMILLLAAATESKFAQFLLARELFRGEIIEEDHAEAFTQINTLADQNFAEAICDLGQFYEHGIGIGKDRQMALLLYEEAAEMGIARAQKHFERLKNSRGLKGLFKKVSLPKVTIPLPKKS